MSYLLSAIGFSMVFAGAMAVIVLMLGGHARAILGALRLDMPYAAVPPQRPVRVRSVSRAARSTSARRLRAAA